jgi:hypothetical protein
MLQFLQQLPSDPMGQGFISSARSNAVLTLSAAAFSIILMLAGSILLPVKSGIPASLFFLFSDHLGSAAWATDLKTGYGGLMGDCGAAFWTETFPGRAGTGPRSSHPSGS